MYIEVLLFVRYVLSRSNIVLGLLRQNLSFCDQQIKEAAGLVRPMLKCSNMILDPHTANLSNEIEKV